MIGVTRGSGKAGRACMRHLKQHGHAVLDVDLVPPAENLGVPYLKADLRDYGQTIAALGHTDEKARGNVTGVVHLAAIPAPGLMTNAATFEANTLSTYHVFEACRVLGINNVVWASSETVLGLPFQTPPPYVPVDEQYAPRPESAYSLSKVMGEEMARQFCRWDPSMKILGLRLSNVMEPDDYTKFDAWQDDPAQRKRNLWGYIDARDAAEAMRLALAADLTGADIFIIANADTTMRTKNSDLLDATFPNVERRTSNVAARSASTPRCSASPRPAESSATNPGTAGRADSAAGGTGRAQPDPWRRWCVGEGDPCHRLAYLRAERAGVSRHRSTRMRGPQHPRLRPND